MDHERVMKMCADKARRTMRAGIGGPFGAAVVKDGKIISIGSNMVLAQHDPTAHAEITAIRMACYKLKTHDLSGCELYATGSPCPMCLSAAIWSNIKKVYVSGLPQDADAIGFKDRFMYNFIEAGCNDESVLEIEELDQSIALDLYEEYKHIHGQLY